MTRSVIGSSSLHHGKLDRQKLGRSIQTLRSMGFAPWAIEYYRQAARKVRKLPHEIVRETACEGVRTTIEPNATRASRNGTALPRKDLGPHRAAELIERRSGSLPALMRRQEFERSLELLKECGFGSGAVDYYRRMARKAGMLPHVVVLMAAQFAAWQALNRDVEVRAHG